VAKGASTLWTSWHWKGTEIFLSLFLYFCVQTPVPLHVWDKDGMTPR